MRNLHACGSFVKARKEEGEKGLSIEFMYSK